MNERYQKHTTPKGQTRKSAAAATVRRGSAPVAKSKSGKASSKSARPTNRYGEPDTPEYKFWRKMWWYALGAGVGFVTASLGLQYGLHATGVLRSISVILVFLSYGALIAAFVIDYRKLKPLRRGDALPSRKKKDDIPDAEDAGKDNIPNAEDVGKDD
jgi:hypothetical protein